MGVRESTLSVGKSRKRNQGSNKCFVFFIKAPRAPLVLGALAHFLRHFFTIKISLIGNFPGLLGLCSLPLSFHVSFLLSLSRLSRSRRRTAVTARLLLFSSTVCVSCCGLRTPCSQQPIIHISVFSGRLINLPTVLPLLLLRACQA